MPAELFLWSQIFEPVASGFLQTRERLWRIEGNSLKEDFVMGITWKPSVTHATGLRLGALFIFPTFGPRHENRGNRVCEPCAKE